MGGGGGGGFKYCICMYISLLMGLIGSVLYIHSLDRY